MRVEPQPYGPVPCSAGLAANCEDNHGQPSRLDYWRLDRNKRATALAFAKEGAAVRREAEGKALEAELRAHPSNRRRQSTKIGPIWRELAMKYGKEVNPMSDIAQKTRASF